MPIVDLDSVKLHLNMSLTDTSQDDELAGFIAAADDLARDVVGPILPETHAQWFDGGCRTVVPDVLPISSVLSATEYYGLSAFALTEQPLGGQMDAFAFTVDYATGEITRRTFGGEAAMFAAGAKNIQIVYVAGRSGRIPATVRLGALELIRHLWLMSQRGGRLYIGGVDQGDVQAVPTGFALPQRVLEMWAPFRRPPGVA